MPHLQVNELADGSGCDRGENQQVISAQQSLCELLNDASKSLVSRRATANERAWHVLRSLKEKQQQQHVFKKSVETRNGAKVFRTDHNAVLISFHFQMNNSSVVLCYSCSMVPKIWFGTGW